MLRLPLLNKYSHLLSFEPSRTELYGLKDSLLILQYNESYVSLYHVPFLDNSEIYLVKYFLKVRKVIFIRELESLLILHENGISLFDRNFKHKFNKENKVLNNLLDTFSSEYKNIERIVYYSSNSEHNKNIERTVHSSSNLEHNKDYNPNSEHNKNTDRTIHSSDSFNTKFSLFFELKNKFVVLKNNQIEEFKKNQFYNNSSFFHWNKKPVVFIDFGLVNDHPVFIVKNEGRMLIFKRFDLIGNLELQRTQIINNKLFVFQNNSLVNKKNCSIFCSDNFEIFSLCSARTVTSQKTFSYKENDCSFKKETLILLEDSKVLNFETQRPEMPFEFLVNFDHLKLFCDGKNLFISASQECPELFSGINLISGDKLNFIDNDILDFIKINEIKKQKLRVDQEFPQLSIPCSFLNLFKNTVVFLILKDSFPNLFLFNSVTVIPFLKFVDLKKFQPLEEIQKYSSDKKIEKDSNFLSFLNVIENTENRKFYEFSNILIYAQLLKKDFEILIEELKDGNKTMFTGESVKITKLLLEEKIDNFKNQNLISKFIFQNLKDLSKINKKFINFYASNYESITLEMVKEIENNTTLPFHVFKEALKGFNSSTVEFLIKMKRKDLAVILLYKQRKDKKQLLKIKELIGDFVFIEDNKFIGKEVL